MANTSAVSVIPEFSVTRIAVTVAVVILMIFFVIRISGKNFATFKVFTANITNHIICVSVNGASGFLTGHNYRSVLSGSRY